MAHTYDGRHAISIRLDPDLYERVSVAAKERRVSKNYLVVRLLEESMDRLVPVAELKLTRD